MIMTMRELVYVRLLGNKYKMFTGQWSRPLGQGWPTPTYEIVNTSAGWEHTSQPEC